MRKPIIAGNWKMHKTSSETKEFILELLNNFSELENVEVVICPPFTSLETAANLLKGSNIKLGAQNVHYEKSGAFTGEVAPDMLKDLGVDYCIIGHSERRQYFGETDETVNKKVKAVLEVGIIPIMCVGETLSERENGETESVCKTQVTEGLKGLTAEEIKKVVIAYEPVWAIGTGKSATKEDADETIGYIRKVVEEIAGKEVADAIRIQYGGSVKPENITSYMEMPQIDGALVGGASLQVKSFLEIAKF
ncbi:triose-phosphate isomerase [Anaerobranca gottschalkii]|uniref:Triosephosphate isomerase n=1 Tax=Anaerobranca gottschalkii DSM 13577 TaxID=1120990 RepID=A0A1I0AHV2_9FIRM|nr:triose-phosphate isomerase [Anaerobranca gottschalkii]SES93866.1 triosephosphate isomerase [Anaerobranca gottschalkii DSM 13577]